MYFAGAHTCIHSSLAKRMKVLTTFIIIAALSISALTASPAIRITEDSIQEWLSEIEFDFAPLIWIPSYGVGETSKSGTLYSTIEFSCVSLTEEERGEFFGNLSTSYTKTGYTKTGGGESEVDGKEIIRKFIFENDDYRIFLVFVSIGKREATELVAGPRKSLDDFVIIQTIETK